MYVMHALLIFINTAQPACALCNDGGTKCGKIVGVSALLVVEKVEYNAAVSIVWMGTP